MPPPLRVRPILQRVLVTDGEQRSSLAVVRSLGTAGHTVAVCSPARRPIAGASRWCARTYLTPPPQAGTEALVAGVTAAAKDFGATILIPMTDVSTPLLLAAADTLTGLTIPFPQAATFARISDKAHLTDVARAVGIPVPEQRLLDSPSAAAPSTLVDLGLPLVLKPARSAVDTQAGPVRVTVHMADTEEDVETGLASFPAEAYPILAQRRITGPGLGVFLLAWEGEILAAFAHRRLREKPPTGGVSVYRESVPVRPDLLAYSRTLLEAFKWRGVAMVEFKEDAATGVPYLMEVNGRFWGSLQLAVDSGVDFPRLLLNCATGGRIEPAPPPRLGVRSRWLWGDVDHLLAVLRATGEERAAHPELRRPLATLARFLVPWKPGDRFEVLRPGDPRPFLVESLNWFAALRHG